MKTKREEGTDTDDNDPKRRKLSDDDAESSPLPVLANDNPLLPLASYSDDDEEEMVQENGYNNANQQNGQNTPDDGGDDDDDDDEEDHVAEEELNRGRRKRQVEVRRDCPYLDTVNRQVLNFDFEKFCSVSLSNLNVYACLVCGKYYQGRGRKSHAYTHSLEAGHHVYINLETEKVYCLPDGYEISDPSLDDIRHVLYPRFNKEQVLRLDKNKQWSGALDGSDYLPGMVGLNNVKERPAVDVELWEQAAGVKKNYVKGLGTKRKYSSAETCSSSSFSSQPLQTSCQMPHTLADCLRVVSQDVGLLAEFDYLRSQLTPEQKAAAAARIAAAAAPQPASHPPDNSEDLDADA